VHWRGGWAALLATVGARAILTALAGLVLVALLPLVLGWHSTVVMTGSMQPRLQPGDVVVSRSIATDRLQLGQVLLVDDPDHPGGCGCTGSPRSVRTAG
jgi:Signal peptidase I